MDRTTDNDSLYVMADEAARSLGVSVTTLYAYVGRKRIRSQRVPGTRQRRYWRADIERLCSGDNADSESARSGVSQESEITLITPQGPYYRGRSALELAETFTLEATAAHLWQVDEQSVFSPALPRSPAELRAILRALNESSAVDKASALFPLIEHANPRAFDLSPSGMCKTGADVLRWYSALLVGNDRPRADPIHATVGAALKLSKELTDLVRCMLVLSADHGFEAATYAVRACASAGVTPYRCVLVGLAVVTGRRSKFGRTETLTRLLEEIASEPDPGKPILRRIREGDALPGFGSSVYAGADPRARFLLKRCEAIFGGDKDFKKLRKAIETAKDATGLEPDYVLATFYAYGKIGVSLKNSLFPLGRSVGWIAHAIEQFQAGEKMRAPVRYTGPLPG